MEFKTPVPLTEDTDTCLNRMAKRRKTVEEFCAQQPQTGKDIISEIQMNSYSWNILVIESLYLLIDLVPKCTTSSMKVKIYEILMGSVNYNVGIPELEGIGVQHLNAYSREDIDYILKHYLKLVVVRNPLDRILSAYMDKIENPKESYFARTSWYIAKNVRYWPKLFGYHGTPGGEKGSNWWPSFNEFVTYITGGLLKDEHWSSMVEISMPCQVNYTFIAHVETFKQDMDCVWGRIHNVSTWFPWENANNASLQTLKYYKNMTKDLISKFVTYFAEDFEAFGYGIQVGD